MRIDPSVIAAAIVNFIILYFILRHFLFTPVNNTINSREKEIKDRITRSEEDEKKAEELRLERERKLQMAKAEGKEIVENFKVKAEKLSSEVVKEAHDEANLIMQRAKTEAEREKEKAEEEIKNQVVDLAILLSSKALQETIDEDKHRKLINDFISKVGI